MLAILNTCGHGKRVEQAFRLSMHVCVLWWLRAGSTSECGRWLCRLLATTCGWIGESLKIGWPVSLPTMSRGFTFANCRCSLASQASMPFECTTPINSPQTLTQKGYSSNSGFQSLRLCSTEYIHKPYELPPLMQMMMGVDLSAYPKPIVDMEQSARIAKDKVFTIKKSLEAKRVSQQVFQRHGSRRQR